MSSSYYQYARYRVPSTGVALAKFIGFLNPDYGTLHLIGYDLGAHVAGIAGKNSFNGRVNRIIGLDPSRQLINEYSSAGRLSSGDATLVEALHSNGDQLGIFQPIADVDYYINNGRNQPECQSSETRFFNLSTVLNFIFSWQQRMLSLPSCHCFLPACERSK